MAQITNSRDVKEISPGAEDLKQVRENHDQLKGYKCENINGHDGITRADNFFYFSFELRRQQSR